MDHSKQEVIAKGQFAALLGANVTITGMWAWAAFDTKPSREIRDQLKSEGFRWGKGKGKWYFAGKRTTGKKPMTWDYIMSKYGAEVLA
jgi:hypothetical protein